MGIIEKLFGRNLTQVKVNKLLVGTKIRVDGRIRTIVGQEGIPGYEGTQTLLNEEGKLGVKIAQKAVTAVDRRGRNGSRVRSVGFFH